MNAYDYFSSGEKLKVNRRDDGISIWEEQTYLITQVTKEKVTMENTETGDNHPPQNYEFILERIEDGDIERL